MKKAYTKPLIAMESFQLNAAIAGACRDDKKLPETNILNHYQSSCTLAEESGDVYFGAECAKLDGIDVTKGDWVDPNGTLCYHGPISPSAVFLES